MSEPYYIVSYAANGLELLRVKEQAKFVCKSDMPSLHTLPHSCDCISGDGCV